MSKRIIGLLILLIIVGAGYFVFSQNQKEGSLKEIANDIRLGEVEMDYEYE